MPLQCPTAYSWCPFLNFFRPWPSIFMSRPLYLGDPGLWTLLHFTWQSNINSSLCLLHFTLIKSKGTIHPKIKNAHFSTFLAMLFIELNCFRLSCRVFGDIGRKKDVCLFSNLMEVGLWHSTCQRKYIWKKKMNSYVSGKNTLFLILG